jgi:hypothetical protein
VYGIAITSRKDKFQKKRRMGVNCFSTPNLIAPLRKVEAKMLIGKSRK